MMGYMFLYRTKVSWLLRKKVKSLFLVFATIVFGPVKKRDEKVAGLVVGQLKK